MVKIKHICSILLNNIFTNGLLCLQKSPRNEHFSNVEFRKIEYNLKTKTDVHNSNVSSNQNHLISFFSFSTFKPCPETKAQNKSLKGNMQKWERCWSFKKRLEKNKLIRIMLTKTIIDRSSVGTENLNKYIISGPATKYTI